MYSNYLNSQLYVQDKSVYASTERYNYGPIKYHVLGAVRIFGEKIGKTSVTDFQNHIAITLAIIDCLLFLFILKLFGKNAAFIYIASSISILISGSHGQHDNMAILFGLIGWGLYQKNWKNPSQYKYCLSAIFFGLSLMAKHILFLFPIWLLFGNNDKRISLKEKALFTFLIYLIFVGGFVGELSRHPDVIDSALKGIVTHVINYRSVYQHSFITPLLDLFLPEGFVKANFSWMPVFKDYTFFYILFLSLYGFITSRKWGSRNEYLPLYLAASLAFSPAVAPQYAVIPLIAMAAFSNNLSLILFHFVTVAHMFPFYGVTTQNMYDQPLYLKIFDLTLLVPNIGLLKSVSLVASQAWVSLFLLLVIFRLDYAYSKDKFSELFKKLYAWVSHRLYIVHVIFILVTTLFMLIRSNRVQNHKPDIHIISSSYGSSCGIKPGNVTDETKKECEGREYCKYKVIFKDPAPGCIKDYKVFWSCGAGFSFFQIGSKTTHIAEAYGKEVILSCMQKP
jgi:hypothetical protein